MKKTVKIIAFVLIICCCCSTLASCKPQGKCNYVRLSSDYDGSGYIVDCYDVNDNYLAVVYYVKPSPSPFSGGPYYMYAIAYKPHVYFYTQDEEPKNVRHATKSKIFKTVAEDYGYYSIKSFQNGIKVSTSEGDKIYFDETFLCRLK